PRARALGCEEQTRVSPERAAQQGRVNAISMFILWQVTETASPLQGFRCCPSGTQGLRPGLSCVAPSGLVSRQKLTSEESSYPRDRSRRCTPMEERKSGGQGKRR